jgi:hypothetical protein
MRKCKPPWPESLNCLSVLWAVLVPVLARPMRGSSFAGSLGILKCTLSRDRYTPQLLHQILNMVQLFAKTGNYKDIYDKSSKVIPQYSYVRSVVVALSTHEWQ